MCKASSFAHFGMQIFKLVLSHGYVEKPDTPGQLKRKSPHCGFLVFATRHHTVDPFLPNTFRGKPQDNGDLRAMPSSPTEFRLLGRGYHQGGFSLPFHPGRNTLARQLLF